MYEEIYVVNNVYSFIFNDSLNYPSDDISFGGSLEDECS